MQELDVFSVGNKESDTQVVLCHGFGASGHDLVDLARYLDPDLAWAWHFPQGPVSIPGFFGYAWFPRTPPELQQALAGDFFSSLAKIQDPGLEASAFEVASWLRSRHLEKKKTIVGGFSQGSMVALRLALQELPHCIAALILSGSLIDAGGTGNLLEKASTFPVFQSHGTFDTVLPLEGALSLRKLLEDNGHSVEWHSFPGGHEIPVPVLSALKIFLQKLK